MRERDPDVPLTLLCEEPELPYDRVALSHLLARRDDARRAAAAPRRVVRGPRGRRAARRAAERAATSTRGAARSRDGSALALRPRRALHGLGPARAADRRDRPARRRSPSATRRTATAIAARGARAARARGRDRRRPARPRGRATGSPRSGCATTVVHLMDRLMERQLDAGAAALLLRRRWRSSASTCCSRRQTAALARRRTRVERPALRRRHRAARPTSSSSRSASGRRSSSRAPPGSRSSAGSSSTTAMVTSHPRVLAVGECAAAPRRRLRHRRADPRAGGGRRARRSTARRRRLRGLGADGEAEGDGRRPRVASATPTGAREVVVGRRGARHATASSSSTPTAAPPAPSCSATRAARAAAGRGRAPAREVDDPLALLAEACAGDRRRPARHRAGLQLQRRLQGRDRRRDPRRRARLDAGGRRRSRAPARAAARASRSSSELLAIERGGAAEEPAYLCPCRQADARGARRGRARARASSRSASCRDACGAGPRLRRLQARARLPRVARSQANRHREERHARFINDRVHANIQNDGTFSRRPAHPRRRDDARRAAPDRRRGRRYEVPMVKITGGQRIDLLGIAQGAAAGDLGGARHAVRPRLREGGAHGEDVRRHRLLPLRARRRDRRRASSSSGDGGPATRRTRSSRRSRGCPRNCAEAYVKDIGLVAVEGGWEVYVGGAAGATVRKGDLLATRRRPATRRSGSRSPSCSTTASTAEYLERTYAYIERVGHRARCARRCSTRHGRPRCSSATRSPRRRPTPTRGASATTPVHPKQFAELDSEPDARRVRSTEAAR